MPTLGTSNSPRVAKLMLIGQSGAGKTGALTSLVAAGYKLRIIDMDMGLDALVHHVQKDCPDRLDSIQYQTFRDKMAFGPMGPRMVGVPKAFTAANQALDKWDDGSVPSEWDRDTVVVIDSLTAMGRAAFQWAKSVDPTAKEPRQHYFAAQSAIEGLLANLTAEDFNPNVIVITHIDLREMPGGGLQGYPTAIGKALGPKVAGFFNTLLLAESAVQGASAKRSIRTIPTPLVGSVKLPKDLPATLPIESGLATVFEALRGGRPAST